MNQQLKSTEVQIILQVVSMQFLSYLQFSYSL